MLNRVLGITAAVDVEPSASPTYVDLPSDHWAYDDIIEASKAYT